MSEDRDKRLEERRQRWIKELNRRGAHLPPNAGWDDIREASERFGLRSID